MLWRFEPILSAGFAGTFKFIWRLRLRTRLCEIINLARGFRFLRVFVAVIQKELRASKEGLQNLYFYASLEASRAIFVFMNSLLEAKNFCSLLLNGVRNNLFCS